MKCECVGPAPFKYLTLLLQQLFLFPSLPHLFPSNSLGAAELAHQLHSSLISVISLLEMLSYRILYEQALLFPLAPIDIVNL
jgi:hypothetical protein